MKIIKITFIFFLCLSFNLYANSKIQVEEITTKKGFKFLFVENHDLPKVSLSITFKEAGTAYENSAKQGLAWLTALVIQEGSGENDAKEFAQKLEDKGISLNFNNINRENFTISLNTLPENLEEGISLLSDAIIRPKVDSTGLNKALEEAKVTLNNLEKHPYVVAIQELFELLFKQHPYSQKESGTLDTIKNITREDILTYIKRNFTKSNIIISVAGDVEKEKMIKLLDNYLSKLPLKRSKIREIPVKNNFYPPENKQIFMDMPQSVIFFAQKGISYDDPNYCNAVVLINALGGISFNSLLMRELRQKLGITYNVNLTVFNRKHGNVIVGNVSTDSTTAGKSISVIKEVFSKIKKEGIDEQLFKDTKISLVNSYIFSIFNNYDIVVRLDHTQINDRDINHINNYAANINKVKLEEVNKLAQSLLDPENLFFVEVGRNTKS